MWQPMHCKPPVPVESCLGQHVQRGERNLFCKSKQLSWLLRSLAGVLFLDSGAPACQTAKSMEVRVHYLKSILAALFVGEIAYVLAIVAFLFKNFGLNTHSAIGVRVLWTIATNPFTIGIGLLFFVLALILFLRTS